MTEIEILAALPAEIKCFDPKVGDLTYKLRVEKIKNHTEPDTYTVYYHNWVKDRCLKFSEREIPAEALHNIYRWCLKEGYIKGEGAE